MAQEYTLAFNNYIEDDITPEDIKFIYNRSDINEEYEAEE